MTSLEWGTFSAIWVVDSEFTAPDGDVPIPICIVARNICTGETHRLWADDLSRLPCPPFGTRPDELIVAFYASAEMGVYLALRWPTPRRVLDLYVEFSNLVNDGRPCAKDARSMLGASAYLHLPVMDVAHKTAMRNLAIRGGPFTGAERIALLAYCEEDVRAEAALLERMRPLIDLPRALLRGRSMVAVAHCERNGVPIDVPHYERLRDGWENIRPLLVHRVNQSYDVYDEDLVFRHERFERYLVTHRIPWPRTETGQLELKTRTFKDMCKAWPQLHALRELRSSLSELRLGELAIGPDGRNRVLLSPFRAKTGRFAPSTARFVFGPSTWVRALIRPEPGWGLAYVDYAQQELAIAAKLSGDTTLQAAYLSGDPYLTFAIHAGAAPAGATKQSHGDVRERFKTCMLGMQYGMAEVTLGQRIDRPPIYAAQLIAYHKRTYPTFWAWSEAAQSYAMATNQIHSRFGWRLRITPETRVRTLANFPAQSNGAEMLRVALCLLTEAGIRVCAPVHDAVLVEAPLPELEHTVERARQLMAEASRIVLDGFTLRTEATLVRFPHRYSDARGVTMWRTVTELLRLEEAPTVERRGVRM